MTMLEKDKDMPGRLECGSYKKPDSELLDMAQACGATRTGKPEGSEPISVVFSIKAWWAFCAKLKPVA